MKKFFFTNQACALLTICGLLGLLMAFGLPALDGVRGGEVLPHMIYWSLLPVFSLIGLWTEHRRRQNAAIIRRVFA